MKDKSLERYTVILLLLFLLVLSAFILYNFITVIFLSAIIAYLFQPVYYSIANKTKSKNVSAILTMVLMIIIILIPSIFFFNSIISETQVAYITLKSRILTDGIIPKNCTQENIICNVQSFFQIEDLNKLLNKNLETVMNSVIEYSSRVFFSIPKKILDGFLMIFLLFFFLRDGKDIFNKMEDLIPLKKKDKADIIRQFNDVTRAVIYGTVVVAIVQGLLGALGFYLFGLSAPLFWGLVMTIAAFLPFIGTALVWGSASIYLIISGLLNNTSSILFKGIGLLLYGALVIGMIDNLIKPMIISKRARIHPIIIFLGAFGGLISFGFIGIFAGPLILIFLLTFFKIMKQYD